MKFYFLILVAWNVISCSSGGGFAGANHKSAPGSVSSPTPQPEPGQSDDIQTEDGVVTQNHTVHYTNFDILFCAYSHGGIDPADKNDLDESQELVRKLEPFIAELLTQVPDVRISMPYLNFTPGVRPPFLDGFSRDRFRLGNFFTGDQAMVNCANHNLKNMAEGGYFPIDPTRRMEIIMMSDDDSSGGELETFAPPAGLSTVVSAMVGSHAGTSVAGCGIDRPGTKYAELARKTGGSVMDICAADKAALARQFLQDMRLRPRIYNLSKKPKVESIRVAINGVPLAADAFSYDAVAQRLTLRDVPPSGASIEIKYVPAA